MRQPIPFGKYLLLDRISVGGMAEVFKAKSYGVEGFEKVIAIKRILPSMGEDRDFIKMFIDEAKIVGQLAHANICQIFELGRTDGAHFIAMEYIWGKDLLQIQNRLRKLKQQMPVAMAAFLIAKVCEGLDYAHKKRDALGRPLEIVHRDCSPQNILVSYEGEVKIIDFGIAKAASRSSKTQAGVLKGKFGYMSPEQVRGLPLDRRSDLFSIGTILYECLTGDRLFVGETDFSTLEKVRNVDVPPPRSINPNIPEVVERIIMKALARDADDRYQWCSEVVADLQRYLMSQDQVFTAKSLATWIKEAFAADLEKERQQLEAFKKVGREGLIAGVPQAEAKLDVVEHLGQAGQAEDPTVLGGPSFDDIIAEAAAAGAVAATPGAAAATNHGDEFVEEGPTEIFGEISEVAAVPANAPAAGTPAVVVAPSVRRPTNHPPLQGSGPVPAVPAAAARPGVASPDDATISPLGMPGLAIPPIPSAQQQRAAMQAAAAQAPANSQAKTLLGMSAPVLPLQPPPTGAGPVVDPAVALAGMSPGQLHGPASQAGIPVQGFPPPDQFPHGSHPPQVGPGGFAHPSGPYQGLPAYGTGPYPGQPYPVPGGQPYPAPGGQPYPTGPHAYPQYPGPMAGYGGPQGAAPVDMTQRRRKKPSLAKDIGIGVGIAVLVLGVFAVVKFVVLADGDKPVAAAAVPTAAVAPELVAIDAAPAAMVQPDAPPATALVVDGGTELADGDGGVAIASADADAGTVMAAAPDGGQAAVAAVDAGVAAVVPVDAAPAVKVADAEPKADSRDERRKVDSRRDERRTVDKIDLDGVVKPKTDPKTDAKTDGKTDPKTDPTRTKPDPKLDVKPDPKADPKVDASVGYLTAYATPFAQVAIDGKPTGKTTPITPMGKIALTPGVHKVTFSVGREKFTYTVKIEAGKTAKITKDLPVTASSDDGN